jgi:protein gp37
VFAGSEADIFGKWVPTEWIQRILDIMRDTPQWEYLMLTKFPQRLSQFEWPDNVWAGTTIDTQARMRTASKWMPKVKAGVVWASCEPLLEEFKFDDEITLGWANFVVAGAQTKTIQPNGVGVVEAIPVTLPALVSLYNEVKSHNIRFYTKSNMTGPTVEPGDHHRQKVLPGIEPIRKFPR